MRAHVSAGERLGLARGRPPSRRARVPAAPRRLGHPTGARTRPPAASPGACGGGRSRAVRKEASDCAFWSREATSSACRRGARLSAPQTHATRLQRQGTPHARCKPPPSRCLHRGGLKGRASYLKRLKRLAPGGSLHPFRHGLQRLHDRVSAHVPQGRRARRPRRTGAAGRRHSPSGGRAFRPP